MNKPFKIKPVVWFLAGWLVVFAALFQQSVVPCFGELEHVELEILGARCCSDDPDHTLISADVSANLPANCCVDCVHIPFASWYFYSHRQFGKEFGRQINIRNQTVCIPAPAFTSLDKHITKVRLAVADPIQPLLIEHLSTIILIC